MHTMSLPTTNRGVLLTLWKLGGPVTIQILLSSALALVDTLMVSGVGTAALAGVGVVGRVYFVLGMVLAGLSSGTAVLVAQYAGARRLRAARGPIFLAVLLGLALTLPMTVVSLLWPREIAALLSPDAAVIDAAATFLFWSAFVAPLTAITSTLGAVLRSTGNTRLPMWAGLAALGVNTVLNVLFINGNFGMPAYGVAAAAAATTVARIVEMIWLTIALKPGPLLRLHAGLRRRDADLVMGSSGPLMLKEIAWAGGILASTLIISRMGEKALAAYHLIVPVDGVMISAVVGCAVATGILLGHALGRSAFGEAADSARRMLRMVSRSAFALGIVLALLVQGLRHAGWLEGAIDPVLHDDALDALTMLCVGFGARAHNTMVTLGILRSGNDSRWLFQVDLCSMWLVNVPLVAFAALVLHWPLPAVVAVMTLEEVCKVWLFGWRVKSGRWLQKIA